MNKRSQYLKTLAELYPPYLIALFLFPILVGYFIDPDLFDSRSIVLHFIWLPLLTVPFSLFRKRKIYQFATVVYFFVGFIEICHWALLKGPITITSFLVMANTNYQEALEFMDVKNTGELLLLLPYSMLFMFSFKRPPKQHPSRKNYYLIGLVSLVSVVFILENALNGRLIRKGTPQIVKVTLSFVDKWKLYQEALKENNPREVEATATIPNDEQTVVLIIGESCNRNHMSLYGAARKTNPLLEKRTDIIAYNNVVAPYSNTINAVLSMLSQANLENKRAGEQSVDIIDVFHAAGFKTYWISNQSPIGIWENVITVFAKKTDHFRFVNTTSNSSFEAILNVSYDDKLFQPFISALHEKVNKKLIVLHLMGSHTAYSKRYPKEFDVFKGANSKEETIAAYDNSVLYNDFIVDSLFNAIQSHLATRKNTLLSAVYLSDHGENVYDELDKVGHDYAGTLPKANVEVPMLVWLSPAYVKLDTARVTTIHLNKNKPFVSDDLFHSILDLNGIQGPYLEEKRSIFNEKFNAQRPRILEDGKDYDKK